MNKTCLVIAGVALAFAAGCTPTVTSAQPAGAESAAAQSPATAPGADTSAAQPARPTAPPPSVIGTYGLGPYQLGVSAKKLVKAGKLTALPHVQCGASFAPRAPYSPGTVEVAAPEGTVAMVKTDSPRYRTPSGAQVGMPEAELLAKYRMRLTAYDNPNDPGSRDYVLRVGKSALGFSLDKTHHVAEIIAGDASYIDGYLQAGEFYGC